MKRKGEIPESIIILKINNISTVLLTKPLILLPHKYKPKSSEQEQPPVAKNELQHKLKKQQNIKP